MIEYEPVSPDNPFNRQPAKPKPQSFECGGRLRCGCRAKGSKGKLCSKCGNVGLCHGYAMENGRCKMHNGNAARGVAHYNYKDAGWSKYCPQHLRGKAAEVAADPDIVSLRENLEALKVRMYELTEALGDPGKPWGEVTALLGRLSRVVENDEGKESVDVALKDLQDAVDQGRAVARSYEGRWAQLLEVNDQYTKTAAAEWKRLNDLRAVIPAEQAVLFATNIMELVLEVYGRDDKLGLLQRRVLALMPQQARLPAVTEGEAG